jgi:hypothetical protein
MTHARGTTFPTGNALCGGTSRRARGYSTAALDDVLGLLLLVVYIAAIVGLAAGITYAVIKIFPTERNPNKPDKEDTEPPKRGDESVGGRLFRRAKREAT